MESPWIARAVAWWLVAACAACGPFEPTSPLSPPPPSAPGSLVCGAPAEACGAACVDLLTDPNHCGRCDHACESGVCRFGTCTCPSGLIDRGNGCAPAVDESVDCNQSCRGGMVCREGRCQCPLGWLPCDYGWCVDAMTDTAHCGACFRACGAAQVCDAGRCACRAPNVTACGAACVDLSTSPENCGACFARCGDGRECRAGRCACAGAGEVPCGETCANLQNDPLHCGTCGLACPTGTSCAEGRCLPRPIEPPSGARVAQTPQTFRWSADGARVQVCADRACARVVRTLTSSNREVRLSEALEPGVYFWRLQTQDGAASSRVAWPLRVDARSAPRSGLLPPDFDLDGDGLADVVALDARSGRLAVFFGARGPLSATPDASFSRTDWNQGPIERGGDLLGGGTQWVRRARATEAASWPGGRTVTPTWENVSVPARAVFDVNNDGWNDYVGANFSEGSLYAWFGSGPAQTPWSGTLLRTLPAPPAVAGVGDVNGDGFSDVLVGSAPRAWVYYGSSTGLDRSSVVPVAPRSDGFGESVSAAGDLNGDGYADLLVRVRRVGAAVYLGGPTVTLHQWIASPTGDDLVVSRAGDVNGDGYGDLVAVPVTSGAAWLYLGGPAGLPEGPLVLRDTAWAGADGTLAAPGDINGDGFDDVYFGVPSSDEVRVLYGSASAPLTRVETLRGAPGSEFGLAVLE